ncbi:MAG: hypothetical protein A3J74_07950 [Elusimicrobia bacterium RIFCSPHIGHO2_02_FULL_57_9]|nr:MAG: hypothetical protein A3J74_07950 [Elusimicrobia bacterium RIFCSPHIGHO2_02_FULL_57_9]
MKLGVLSLLLLPAFAQETRVIDNERQNILAEMWQRKILSAGLDRYSPAEMALLARMRRAEAGGAIELLKSKGYPLRNLIVVRKRAGGLSDVRLRLTQEGFLRYQLVLAQEALTYFENKGVGAKWAFHLMDLDDRPLFDSKGLLSEAGEDLFQRAKAGEEAYWKTVSGEILGNRPPAKTP